MTTLDQKIRPAVLAALPAMPARFVISKLIERAGIPSFNHYVLAAGRVLIAVGCRRERDNAGRWYIKP